ncbi:tRNA dihydrouridine synthase [[Clostridium] hylemonae]|uniref:tRNA dihydrouridine synthase n=1 Tax=[Clostridium] hylemonae TaxID=89153 RepID=UPI0011060C88|nr:tRNA-dihydrouridine synthase family protein [[Clostridium] hylemonae]
MDYYFAPMEGITGYIHRSAYQALFPCIDKYFTAFIAPNQHGKLSSREKNDILPEHNRGIKVIPQLLTNKADDFILTAGKLKEYGYREVNLNLGCPSRTVVSKYRGSGFLARPEELDRFLYEVFEKTETDISVKTRTGRDSPREFVRLMEIYNKYPLKELIIHPRTQQDFYKNTPDLSVFAQALSVSRCPVCYNGDIFTTEDLKVFRARFANVDKVMLGRGLLVNPMLIEMAEDGTAIDTERIRKFHDMVYGGYREVLSGDKVILFKMKELWSYMIHLFSDSKKYAKKIRKSEKLPAYEEAVDALFLECPLREPERNAQT